MPKTQPSTPPFRQSHLLTTRSFISYCSEHGIDVDTNDLETLHRLGLLVPVVQVFRGVVPFRKIYCDFDGTNTEEWRYVAADDLSKFKPKKTSKQTYYTAGSLLMGKDDWLDWYQERGMVGYPALEKFKPWRHEAVRPDYTTSVKEVAGSCEFMYERYQVLLLRQIIRARRVYGIDSVENLPAGARELLRTEAKKFYAFIAFYLDAEAAFDRLLEARESTLTEIRSEYGDDRKEIQREWRGRLGGDLRRPLELKAKALLEQHGYSVEQVRDWQRIIASSTVFGQARHSSGILRKYLAGVSEETLVTAEDANYMIFILNTTIEWATGEQCTVREALGDWSGLRCAICHQLFRPAKKTQLTCGSSVCAAAHKNDLKRINRKNGRYRNR